MKTLTADDLEAGIAHMTNKFFRKDRKELLADIDGKYFSTTQKFWYPNGYHELAEYLLTKTELDYPQSYLDEIRNAPADISFSYVELLDMSDEDIAKYSRTFAIGWEFVKACKGWED